MLNARTLSRIFSSISELMEQNRDYLVRLDQVNGDGDLGISMDDGFRAAAAFFAESLESGEETDRPTPRSRPLVMERPATGPRGSPRPSRSP